MIFAISEALFQNSKHSATAQIPAERARRFSFREKPVSALTLLQEKRVSALTGIFSIYAQNALFSILTVLAFADVNSPARKTRSR